MHSYNYNEREREGGPQGANVEMYNYVSNHIIAYSGILIIFPLSPLSSLSLSHSYIFCGAVAN